MGIDMTDPKRLMSLADEYDYDRYTRQEFEEMRDIFRENTEYVYRMHEEVMELLKPRPGSRTADRRIIEEQFEDIERGYERRQREEEDREEEERRMRLMREEEDAERREEEMRRTYAGE